MLLGFTSSALPHLPLAASSRSAVTSSRKRRGSRTSSRRKIKEERNRLFDIDVITITIMKSISLSSLMTTAKVEKYHIVKILVICPKVSGWIAGQEPSTFSPQLDVSIKKWFKKTLARQRFKRLNRSICLTTHNTVNECHGHDLLKIQPFVITFHLNTREKFLVKKGTFLTWDLWVRLCSFDT